MEKTIYFILVICTLFASSVFSACKHKNSSHAENTGDTISGKQCSPITINELNEDIKEGKIEELKDKKITSEKAVNSSIVEVKYKENNEIKTLYYSLIANKALSLDDIVREHYKEHLYLQNPHINLINTPIENFALTDKYLILNNKYKLNYYKYKDIFKAGIGLPCLYEGELKIGKTRPILPNKKYIAFTFDDGPGNKYHDSIRNLFNHYNQSASFCVVGSMVQYNKHRLIKTVESGHQIINHSYTHHDLSKMNYARRWKEILNTDDIVFKLTGYDIKYVRPPYGAVNKDIRHELKKKLALWDIDSEDWRYKDKNRIIQNVLPYVKSLKVALFHDLYKTSYLAVKEMVPLLINEGYQFVTYEQLQTLKKDNHILKHQKQPKKKLIAPKHISCDPNIEQKIPKEKLPSAMTSQIMSTVEQKKNDIEEHQTNAPQEKLEKTEITSKTTAAKTKKEKKEILSAKKKEEKIIKQYKEEKHEHENK